MCENPTKPAPPILSVSLQPQDTIVRINDPIFVTANVSGDNFSRMLYVWSVDNGVPDTTKEFRREYKWGVMDTGSHSISIFAIGDDRFCSEKRPIAIRVKCSFPEVDVQQRDTVVLWGDTLHINPKVQDPDGKVVSLKWRTDVDTLWYSANPIGRNFVWSKFQTGDRWICVIAEDNDGLLSKADTVHVKVSGTSLKIKINQPDSVVQLYQPMALRLSSQGVFPAVHIYQWAIDGIVSGSNNDTLGLTFRRDEAGQHTISVQVFFKDSSVICADTTRITAIYNRIKVDAVLSDTLIYANMALSITPVFKKGTMEDIERMWIVLDGIKNLPVDKKESNLLLFSVADTGIHSIVLNVLDKDSVLSFSLEKWKP